MTDDGIPRRVLGVFAHPDDAEIWAGGTLLAHKLAGDYTAICVLTHGDGDRAKEAIDGAECLGATLHHLSFLDRGLAIAQGATEALAEVMRREQPHIVVTHWAYDSHPDHRATWEITNTAIMLSEIERGLEALFWSDTYNGVGQSGPFQPDCLVDVSLVWEQKLAAIMAHCSQHPSQYTSMAMRQCALRGAAGNAEYAEGFVRVPFIGVGRRARGSLADFI